MVHPGSLRQAYMYVAPWLMEVNNTVRVTYSRVWQRLVLTCASQVIMSRCCNLIDSPIDLPQDPKTQELDDFLLIPTTKYLTLNACGMPFSKAPLPGGTSIRSNCLFPSSLSSKTLSHIPFHCVPITCLLQLIQTLHIPYFPSRRQVLLSLAYVQVELTS